MSNYYVKPYLTTRKLHPENQEAPISFLKATTIPEEYFYRRNHFSYPHHDDFHYYLQMDGKVKTPLFFHYNQLITMSSKTLTVLLECAGNNRAQFEPKVFGEQWEGGAINVGVWRGIPLHLLFSYTGLENTVKEIVFEGFDFGKREGKEEIVSYQRSLPIEKALHPDTIIAYQYNGKPLPFQHGYPFRLIVPEWYGMASVKWLKKITAIDHSFDGPFQTDDYVYYPKETANSSPFPVTTINVNSLIQQPLHLSLMNKGTHRIQGLAWTGTGEITKVEISFNEGNNWYEANLQENRGEKYSWKLWYFDCNFEKEGIYHFQTRATDSTGRIQPSQPFWNHKGYGYNAIAKIKIKVDA